MTQVKFYDSVDDSLLKFAVIIAKSNGKWVFCKHIERDTYECPGGHREAGETIDDTAKRELYEETGAIGYTIQPVCVYSVTAPDNFNGEETFGKLYYAEIKSFEGELHSEIERVELFEDLPTNWTYPQIQPFLLKEVEETIGKERHTVLGGKKIFIRRFRESDAETVSKMIIRTERITNSKDYSEEWINALERRAQPSHILERAGWTHFYVVEENDTIIGCGAIGPYWGSETESCLFNIFVLPEYQGKGIGRKIIETLEQDEYFLRAKRVEVPASITAVNFYRKLGYDYKNGVDRPDEEQIYRLEKFRHCSSVIGSFVTVTVDRPMGSLHLEHRDIYYPINYGYVKGVKAPDGEWQDAYILGVYEPVKSFTGKVIAVIHRLDDIEDKWVVCPESMSFGRDEIAEKTYFQEKFFNTEILIS